jgi:allantoinase
MYAHDREFAPIHDRLPYSPITERAPIQWPGGARLAVWIVPNIEHYEYLPPAATVDPYPRTPHPDVRLYSYRDYGNRVAFWRLLALLDEFEIPCTASLNVAVLEHYPEIRDAMIERNWDLMSHGLYNTRYLTGADDAAVRTFFTTCNDVLERTAGRRFAGLLGPNITSTAGVPDLMAEYGLRFIADLVHDERPTPYLNSSGARLVALPYSFMLNDAPLLMRSSVEGELYAQMCIDNFERLYNEPDSGGRMMCLPIHPFTIGQPHRINHLRRILQVLRQHDDVWIATGTDIVDHYLAHSYDADLALSR